MNARILAALLLLAGAVGLAVVGLRNLGDGSAPRVPFERGERPILFVTVDTTRADRLSPYGQTDDVHPAFDQLAASGVTFEQAMAVAPITLVAHTSMLTGLFPPRHGVRNNGTHFASDELELISETLEARGYETGAIVSAAVLEKRYGLNQGFDTYDDDLSESRQRHERVVADRPAEFTVSRALEWLDRREAGQPWFLWVHLYDPHANYAPPEPYRTEYADRLYDGEIAYLDAELQRLFAHPLVRPAFEGTRSTDPWIVLVADHGESLGEHGEKTHALLAYESTMHVPMFLVGAGLPQAARIAEPVSQVDLVPTLRDALGLRPARRVDGVTLLPAILEDPDASASDATAEGRPSRLLYGETLLPRFTYGWAELNVARLGDWKYIEAPRPELYDLGRDPRELTNVLEQQPSVAHDLSRNLEEFLESADAGPSSQLELDPEAAARLAALGYIASGSLPAVAEEERRDPKDGIGLHGNLEDARAFLSMGLHEQAIDRARQVIEEEPLNLSARHVLIDGLIGEGRFDEARREGQECLVLAPGDLQTLTRLAEVEERSGRPDAALELAQAMIEQHPRVPGGYVLGSRLLRQQGRYEQARSLVEEGRAQVDDERLELEMLAVESGLRVLEPGQQIERARAILDSDPFLAPAWRVLGRGLEETGQWSEAAGAYTEGLQRVRGSAPLHEALGRNLLRRSHDLERAAFHLAEAMRLLPRAPLDLELLRAEALAGAGQNEQAVEALRRVAESEAATAAGQQNRAIAWLRLGETDRARSELERLVASTPSAEGLATLSGVYLMLEREQDAEQAAQESLAIDPTPEAWNNLAILQARRGDTDSAVQGFRNALEIAPNYAEARLNLAYSLFEQSRAEEAAAQLVAARSASGLGDGGDRWRAMCVDSRDPERCAALWSVEGASGAR